MVGYQKNNTEFETVIENNYCDHNSLKGMVVKNLVKIGVLNDQLPEQYILFDQIWLPITIFEQITCNLKKHLSVTDGSYNQKRA